MKKRIIAITLVGAFGISSFLACNKKNIDTTPANSSTAAPAIKMPGSATSPDAAANLGNPYDNVGYDHNTALQATRSVWTNSAATTQTGYNAVASYFASQGVTGTPSFVTISDMDERINADHSVGETTYVGTIGLSSAGSAYAIQLFTIASQVESYASYDDFKNAVIQIESAIISNSQLSNIERQRLLSGASVERHSMLYWLREQAGYNADPTTNGNPSGPVALSFWGHIKKWLNDHPIVKADLAGGLGGVTGGVAGVVGGAAAGSVVEWLLG